MQRVARLVVQHPLVWVVRGLASIRYTKDRLVYDLTTLVLVLFPRAFIDYPYGCHFALLHKRYFQVISFCLVNYHTSIHLLLLCTSKIVQRLRRVRTGRHPAPGAHVPPQPVVVLRGALYHATPLLQSATLPSVPLQLLAYCHVDELALVRYGGVAPVLNELVNLVRYRAADGNRLPAAIVIAFSFLTHGIITPTKNI